MSFTTTRYFIRLDSQVYHQFKKPGEKQLSDKVLYCTHEEDSIIELNNSVKRFWEIETVKENRIAALAEIECVKHFTRIIL